MNENLTNASPPQLRRCAPLNEHMMNAANVFGTTQKKEYISMKLQSGVR
jgi:hypothetical protein